MKLLYSSLLVIILFSFSFLFCGNSEIKYEEKIFIQKLYIISKKEVTYLDISGRIRTLNRWDIEIVTGLKKDKHQYIQCKYASIGELNIGWNRGCKIYIY